MLSNASAREAGLRALGAVLLLMPDAGIVAAGEPMPQSGSAKLAAYAVCRSAVMIDMGPVGSNSSAECTGIVKTRDGSKLLDNLAIRSSRGQGAASGLCLHGRLHPDGRGRRQALHDILMP